MPSMGAIDEDIITRQGTRNEDLCAEVAALKIILQSYRLTQGKSTVIDTMLMVYEETLQLKIEIDRANAEKVLWTKLYAEEREKRLILEQLVAAKC